jgi:DNA-directed RNA polymerase beta' subunit
MTKRHLTIDEINSLFINIESLLPSYLDKDLKNSILHNIVSPLKDEFSKVLIYENVIPSLQNEVEKLISKSFINAGEAVGVICAQSIGERQTQLTLNSFHQAGLAVTTVVSGVPRFLEILNATKEPKSLINTFQLKDKTLPIQKIRKLLGSKIKEIYWKDIYISDEFIINKEEEPWYEVFENMYSNDFRFHPHCLSFKLDNKILYEYNISLTDIKEILEEKFDDIFIVFSPLNYLQIDIFIDLTSILEDNNIDIQNDIPLKIFLNDVLKQKLDETHICGISKIKNFIISKNNCNEHIIEIQGNNMYELFLLPFINHKTIKTNNMWEVFNIVGIEGTRKFLYEELKNIVSSDGTFINPAHLYLLIDIMTFYGTIQSISRYGVKKENNSVLTRATFEESLDHFSKAAFFSEKENVVSVSSSIMCGKRSKIGSGLNSVTVDWNNF